MSVPVLSMNSRSDAGQLLQRVEPLHQHAAPRQAAGRGHQRRRHGQRQRAGTGDDQHRHRHPDGARRVDHAPDDRRPRRPAPARRHRKGPAQRSATRAIEAAAGSCASRISATMASCRVSAPTRCTRIVTGAPRFTLPATTASPGALGTGARFAGEQRLVGRGAAFEQHAVGRERPGRAARARGRPTRRRRRSISSMRPSSRSAQPAAGSRSSRCFERCARAMARTQLEPARAEQEG